MATSTPIVISPVPKTVTTTTLIPVTGTLTTDQLTAIVTALAAAGITFTGGNVSNLNVSILATPNATTGVAANFRVNFFNPVPAPAPAAS